MQKETIERPRLSSRLINYCMSRENVKAADVIEAEQSVQVIVKPHPNNTMTIGTPLWSCFKCIYHQWPNKRCGQSADVIVELLPNYF